MAEPMNIAAICATAPVIPVIVIDDAADAAPLARALVSGGLPVLEVTLRTPAALPAIAAMAKVRGAMVGAGTVLTPADMIGARAHGAAFAVSPGATGALLDCAADIGLPFLPGAVTGSEVMALLARGQKTMKFFPAEAAGGIPLLKSLAAPLPAARFCPTGGIGAANVADYLRLPNVTCVGGSWVAPTSMVRARDWAGIEKLARAAAKLRQG